MLRALGVRERQGFQEVSWSFWGRDSPGGGREGRGEEAPAGGERKAPLCWMSPAL